MRKKRPIDRNEKHVRDTSLIVIASEDQYAVKQYFSLFHSVRVQVRVLETEDGASSPQSVLERLKEYKEEYDIGRDDAFWLVTDTDHWIRSNHVANLTEVVRQCKQMGVGIAISNPCFDWWLLLHFEDANVASNPSCKQVGEGIRSAVGFYDKRKIYNLPIALENVMAAVKRSRARFRENDLIPMDPQTAIHLIVDQMIERDVLTMHRNS
jgi:hypothetical protein